MRPAQDIVGDELIYHLVEGMEELTVDDIYGFIHADDADSAEYIDAINPFFVEEMHVSGHSQKKILDNEFLYIDSHDNVVCEEVWNLFEYALKKCGRVPTLVEWDANIPELEVLLSEAAKIDYYLNQVSKRENIYA